MLRDKNKIKQAAKKRRQCRTRAKIFGTAKLPRLNITKSLNHLYLQLIDDQKGKTLVSLHTKNLKIKGAKVDVAKSAGQKLAEQALSRKIDKCVFDKASYLYHGRVKAAAEGARQAGLKF